MRICKRGRERGYKYKATAGSDVITQKALLEKSLVGGGGGELEQLRLVLVLGMSSLVVIIVVFVVIWVGVVLLSWFRIVLLIQSVP